MSDWRPVITTMIILAVICLICFFTDTDRFTHIELMLIVNMTALFMILYKMEEIK